MREPFARGRIPIPTGAEAAAFDGESIDRDGVPRSALMEAAGREVACVLAARHPRGRIVVLAGPGNNGGDALIAARTLAAWGRAVAVVRVGNRDAAEDRVLLRDSHLPTSEATTLDDGGWNDLLTPAEVVLDGILGIGARGAARGPQARAIERLGSVDVAVVSVDVPSGIDSDSGAVPGAAVRAHLTVALGFPKLGTLLHPARAHVGRLVAVEIGFPRAAASGWARLVTPAWAHRHLPVRPTDTHKNDVGRVVVVAGGPDYGGAAVMVTRAAFRAGAGLVQVATAPSNRDVVLAAVPEALVMDMEGNALSRALERASAVVCGPGLGTDDFGREALERVLGGPPRPTLFDADALNLLASDGLDRIADAASDRPVLLTPHPGELARLGGVDTQEAAERRLEVAAEVAERAGCAVLAKGMPSAVVYTGRPVHLDCGGSSALAVAGVGDVLSGVCGSLMAQGLAPVEAGAVGLYLSGRAARIRNLGAGLMPHDLIEALPAARGPVDDDDSDPVRRIPSVFLDLEAAH